MNSKMLILAGTAMGMIMAASNASALPAPSMLQQPAAKARTLPVQLSAAECEAIVAAGEDEALVAQCRALLDSAAEPAPTPEAAPEPAPEAPPAPEPEPTPEPAPEPEPVEEPAAEQAPAPDTAPEADPASEAVDDVQDAVEEGVDEVEEVIEAPVEEVEETVDEVMEEPESDAGTPEEPAQDDAVEEPVAEEPAVEEPVEEVPVEEPTEEEMTDEPTQPEAPVEPGDAVGDEQPADQAAPPPPPEGEAPVEEGVAPEEYEDAAPLLDSQKEAPQAGTNVDQPVVDAEEAGPAPTTDEEAQAETVVDDVESATAEEGRRIERRDDYRSERREGSEILREIGERVLMQFNNQLVVDSRNDRRLGRDATEVYYEELPRGRTRETVVRPNGVMVVTITDRYGDIVRRSRIMPDGTEYVLVYADERGRDGEGRREWRDPARELPPLRLRIPPREYILEARQVEDPEVYYDFLDSPPVERVERLYSVDEVRYSSRVRDIMPRIELDTLTFEFGSASIGESEVGRLQGMADAMHRLLEEDPAEVFMIEGHTDAVGSEEANLALSDERAQSVAIALTDYFDIPPENLVTQGYGETYLKIETPEPERLNRRVAVRRITPLVSPVASR